MADWLSSEWAQEVASLHHLLPPVPEADGAVALSFLPAPRRELIVHWVYQEGRVTGGGPGPVPPDSAPSLALAIAGSDAADLIAGRVSPSVAFMRGRLKASGDGGLLLGFLACTNDPGWEKWRSAVAELAPPPAAG